MPNDNSFLNNDQVVDFLLDKNNDGKLMLLFEDSKSLKSFSNDIGKYLNSNKAFIADTKKHRVRSNMVQVDDKIIYLGLKAHKDLLLNNYSEKELRYYKDE